MASREFVAKKPSLPPGTENPYPFPALFSSIRRRSAFRSLAQIAAIGSLNRSALKALNMSGLDPLALSSTAAVSVVCGRLTASRGVTAWPSDPCTAHEVLRRNVAAVNEPPDPTKIKLRGIRSLSKFAKKLMSASHANSTVLSRRCSSNAYALPII